MRLIKQSTAYSLVVFMTDASDHVSGKTALTLTITASKAGAAFGSITPTVTELSNGWYKLALTTSHTDTEGDLAIHITGTGADPTDAALQVRPYVMGDTLPASVAGDVGGKVLGGGASTITGTGARVVDGSGNAVAPASATTDIQSRLPAALTGAGNIKADAQVVSDKTGYALTSAYDPAKTAATQTSVDDLPTNSELATALAGADDAVLAAIAALNNLSSAGAQAAAAAALTAYGAATGAQVAAVPQDFANLIEPVTGKPYSLLIRLAAGVGAGLTSGPAPGEAGTFKMGDVGVPLAGSGNLVDATVDSDGNRTAVTVTP